MYMGGVMSMKKIVWEFLPCINNRDANFGRSKCWRFAEFGRSKCWREDQNAGGLYSVLQFFMNVPKN